ncbi:S-phase kinase-associated protein 2 [Plutella xylostella]|uniref:S-phase kinase-associated protein 2 n=1 Tax=Plutella xylostella TaxID=51655 RepID=UPI002032A05C|nr:S-phase kinase-associated protein 2 [Plutella xylostella]
MNLNDVEDEILSPKQADAPESARKRMRLDNGPRPSWSLAEKTNDEDVLLEMGVSLLDPDELEAGCDIATSASLIKSGSKRKRDIENVNPNVNSANKAYRTSPKRSPKGKLWSPVPGPSMLSSPGSEDMGKSDLPDTGPPLDEETPEGQLVRARRYSPAQRRAPPPSTTLSVIEEEQPSVQGRFSPVGADAFAALSDEVMLSIFKWLPKRTLAHCMLVCKRWHRIASDETFWQRLDLGNRIIKKGALGKILARKPVIVRLAGSEIGAWDPPAPLQSRVQCLDASMCSWAGRSLHHLLASCALTKLSLEAAALDEEALRAIALSTKLDTLNLTMATGITAEGLALLLDQCTNLQSLNISWCSLSAPALTALTQKAPQRLTRLNVAGARLLTDELLSALAARCPRLAELDISDCARLTGASLRPLLTLRRLEHLALCRVYLMPPPLLTKLGALPSLQYLEVWGMLQDSSLAALKAALPGIQLNQFMHSAIARPTVGSRRTSIWGLRTRD